MVDTSRIKPKLRAWAEAERALTDRVERHCADIDASEDPVRLYPGDLAEIADLRAIERLARREYAAALEDEGFVVPHNLLADSPDE